MSRNAQDPSVEIGADVETGDPVSIPLVELLRGRQFLLGKSGSGKSNSANVIVEGILDHGRACMIVDVDGEYYGLKEEYELLHATGDDAGDVQVGPEHAGKLADLALEQNVPVILDVSGFLDADDAETLVGRVARELFVLAKTRKQPFLFVVEEAHEYIPEQGGSGFAAEHVTRIARRGRKHGLGLLGISQRPAAVDKDVLTQANLVVWHRFTYETDTNVVKRMHGAEWAAAIEDFADGEAIVEYDAWDALRRVQWHRQRTYDAGAAPGLDETERPALQTIGSDVIEALQAAGDAARSKADRIAQLEDRLADKQSEIDELERELETAREFNAIEEKIGESLSGAFADLDLDVEGVDLDVSGEGSIRADVMEVVERKQALEEDVDELQHDLQRVREERDGLRAEVAELEDVREQVARQEDLFQLRDDLEEVVLERYPDLFDVERDDRVADLQAQLQAAREQVADLEAQVENGAAAPGSASPSASASGAESGATARGLAGMVEHPDVQRAVAVAVDRAEYADRHFDRVLRVLANTEGGGPLTAAEIAPLTDVSESSVRHICKALHQAGVLTTGRDGRATTYALDREFLETRIEVAERQAGAIGGQLND